MLTPQDFGMKMAKVLSAELTVLSEAQPLEASRSRIVNPVPAEGLVLRICHKIKQRFYTLKKNSNKCKDLVCENNDLVLYVDV